MAVHEESEDYTLKHFQHGHLSTKDRLKELCSGLRAESVHCLDPCKLCPILKWFPIFLRQGPLQSLLSDAVSGVTVAALNVPQGLAYGLLAQVPAAHGLYTCILPPLVYMVFGTCMHMSVGAFALIARLAGEGVLEVVPNPKQDPEAAVVAAVIMAFLSGAILLCAGMLRFGFLASLLSDPVLNGCIVAMGILIPTSQLKYAFQVTVSSSLGWIATIIELIERIASGEVNYYSLGIFVVSLFCILGLQQANSRCSFLKRTPIPAELVVVILATATVKMFDLSGRAEVATIGSVPTGLPRFQIPDFKGFGSSNLAKLAVHATVLAIINFMVSISVAKTYSRKFGYEVDANQELVALGLANLAGSVSSSFPAAASLSRTTVIAQTQAATPLHNIWTVTVLILVLLSCGPLLATLPEAALAAIIVLAFKNVVISGFKDMRTTFHVSTSDFIMGQLAFWSTLLFDITKGILIAVVASGLYLNFKSSRASFAILGLLPGTERMYRNCRIFPDSKELDGILIFRLDAPMHFANAEALVAHIWRAIHARSPKVFDGEEESRPETPIHTLLLDFSCVGHVDVTAGRSLKKLHGQLSARQIKLVISHCRYDSYLKLVKIGLFGAPEDDQESTAGIDDFRVHCFRDLHHAVLFSQGKLSEGRVQTSHGPEPESRSLPDIPTMSSIIGRRDRTRSEVSSSSSETCGS